MILLRRDNRWRKALWVWKGLLSVILVFGVLNACSLSASDSTLSPASEETSAPFAAALWTDANGLMRGICFASAVDAVGQVFILRDTAALERFYDLADESGLCMRPVQRAEADFDETPLLVGGWSMGTGCTAQHTLTQFDYDSPAAQAIISLDFSTEGECPYTLVRPFWMALHLPAETEITLSVVDAGD